MVNLDLADISLWISADTLVHDGQTFRDAGVATHVWMILFLKLSICPFDVIFGCYFGIKTKYAPRMKILEYINPINALWPCLSIFSW